MKYNPEVVIFYFPVANGYSNRILFWKLKSSTTFYAEIFKAKKIFRKASDMEAEGEAATVGQYQTLVRYNNPVLVVKHADKKIVSSELVKSILKCME